MILDAQLLFTGGSAPPGTTLLIADNVTASGNSTNVIDLGPGPTNTALPPSQTSPSTQPFRDIGIGDDPAMKILVQPIGPNWAGGTSLAVGIQGAPDNGSGGIGAFSASWYTSTVTTLANLNLGQRLMDMDFPRPPAGVAIPRFIRLAYTVVGPFTGTANYLLATLVLDRADQVYNATNNAIWGGYAPGVVVAN
jgi:hypothetical protein